MWNTSCPFRAAARMNAKLVSLSHASRSTGSITNRMRTAPSVTRCPHALTPLASGPPRQQNAGMPRVLRSPALWLGFWLGVGLLALAPGGRADAPASGKKEAASTEHPIATQAAMDTLKRGGNAADAAAAAALVAGVVGPKSSGIGGGGFAMVLRARAAEPEILDFRETAPAAVDSAALANRPLPWESRGKLTGVPGEPYAIVTTRDGSGQAAGS